MPSINCSIVSPSANRSGLIPTVASNCFPFQYPLLDVRIFVLYFPASLSSGFGIGSVLVVYQKPIQQRLPTSTAKRLMWGGKEFSAPGWYSASLYQPNLPLGFAQPLQAAAGDEHVFF